ncbi:MAG: uracil-DNA glycosylase [Candidatus Margulisbacteria bacterium]|nr:uracil-DNA glycosylase [Candidatus Margulisiibacteriota bacterium]
MAIKKCKRCKFFYITWDSKFPYGCKALGFKSKKYPCDEVRQSSSMECQYFQESTKQD